jgi:hypothetical protein
LRSGGYRVVCFVQSRNLSQFALKSFERSSAENVVPPAVATSWNRRLVFVDRYLQAAQRRSVSASFVAPWLLTTPTAVTMLNHVSDAQ